jgi:hypothetical protein
MKKNVLKPSTVIRILYDPSLLFKIYLKILDFTNNF